MQGHHDVNASLVVAPSLHKRAWAYTRVSSPGQQDNGSLEDQAARCRDRAVERGYDLIQVKQEVFFSDDPDRPVLDDVLDAAKRKEFDILLVDKVDRFSRADPGITGHLVIEFERRGVEVEFVEILDNSFEGQIMRAVLSIVARVESVKIKKRTQEGRMRRLLGNAEKGVSPQLFIASTPLYGYVWNQPDKGKRGYYVVDDEAAPYVVRLFREVASGKPLTTIIREFNAEGIPTPGALWVKRGIWSAQRKRPEHGWLRGIVTRIINEPKYYGEVYAKRHAVKRQKALDPFTGRYRWTLKRSQRAADDADVVQMPLELCPPLVSRELALAAQARLAQNKLYAERNLKEKHRESALLRGGFVVCGSCGRTMIARIYTDEHNAMRQRRGSYCCNSSTSVRDSGGSSRCPAGIPNTINIVELDDAVWQLAVKSVLDPSFLPSKVQHAQKEAGERASSRQDSIANLERLVADAERRRRGYYKSLGELDVEDADGRAFTHTLIRKENDDIKAWRHRIEEMQLAEGAAAVQIAALATVTQRLHAWAMRIADFTYDQKRMLLFALGCKVTVSPRGTDLDGAGSRYHIDFDIMAGLDAAALVDSLENDASGAFHVDSDTYNLSCMSFMPPMRR